MFALNRGVVLIFLILGIFSISQVFGVCCGGSYDLEKIKKRCHVTDDRFANDLCPDCELKTPYCGKGPCNIFGCNCQGGCRT